MYMPDFDVRRLVPSVASNLPLTLNKKPDRPQSEPQDPKKPSPDPQSPGDFPNDQPVQMPGQDKPGTTRPDQESTNPERDPERHPSGPGSIPDDFPGDEPGIAPGEPGDDRELNFKTGVMVIERSNSRREKSDSSSQSKNSRRSNQSLNTRKSGNTPATAKRRRTAVSRRGSVDQKTMTRDTNPQGSSRSPEDNVYDHDTEK